jgi:hypothetical protein
LVKKVFYPFSLYINCVETFGKASSGNLFYLCEARGKEMTVIPVYRVVDKKRIIGKNGGPRRNRGTRGY